MLLTSLAPALPAERSKAFPPASSRRVLIDVWTGRSGDYADWVGRFAELWAGGRANRERFLDLLGPDVRLVAPGFRASLGWDAARQAFARTFAAFPDLRAEVRRWSAVGDAVFIEMRFQASVGGRPFAWNAVDRILFRDGVAIERVAYFDPSRLRRACLRSLSGLWQLLRLRLGI